MPGNEASMNSRPEQAPPTQVYSKSADSKIKKKNWRHWDMADSAVFFGALVGVAAFLTSFSLHKIEEGMVTGGASR